jgi:hypothetical protein
MIRINEDSSKQVWVPAEALMQLVIERGYAFEKKYVNGKYEWQHLPTPETDLPSMPLSTEAALKSIIAAQRLAGQK